MLFRRLKNFMEDKVAKVSLISTASKIKPPLNLESWLSSLEISIDVDKSIVDQLLGKNSKEVFQKLYHVLFVVENDKNFVSKNNKRNAKLEDNQKEETSSLTMSLDLNHTPNEDMNSSDQYFDSFKSSDKKINEHKNVLDLPKLCNKIKSSNKKKKHPVIDGDIKSITKPKQQPKNTKSSNLIERTFDSENISAKPKKPKKKSKTKNVAADATVVSKKADANSKKPSKSAKSKSKNKKLKKKKKSKETDVNVIPDSKKSDIPLLKTNSNLVNSFNNDNSVSVNSKFPTEKRCQTFECVNDLTWSENYSTGIEDQQSNKNIDLKDVKITHSASENQISQRDKESCNPSVENSVEKISNIDCLSSKLPNLLANYEIYSSADENGTSKKNVSSCPLVESSVNILVPDTCQDNFNSIVPFNLDSWVPSKDDTSRDTSVSMDESLISDKYPHNWSNDAKKHNMYKDSYSDYSNSSFNDSVVGNVDSEVSRDTLFSNDGSQISDKYPYVSLVDIRKTKKFNLYQTSDCTNSSFDYSNVGVINDSEMSRDTCISNDGSQISDKNPYVSLIDIRKMKNLSVHGKSDISISSFASSVGNINGSEMPQDILKEKSQILDKNIDYIEEAESLSDHHRDSNYDPILGNINDNAVIDISNQIPDSLSCNDLHITESKKDELQNNQDGILHGELENGNSELPSDETHIQSKKSHESHSPCNTISKIKTPSRKRNVVNANLKSKVNSSTERKINQTNYKLRKQQKRKCSSDDNKDLVQPKKGNYVDDLETTAKDVNSDAYLNDLSTLLANHGDMETQENENISPSLDIAINHSDTQDLSQFQEPNPLHVESNIIPYQLNEKQSCITLPNENHHNTSTCSIETVIDEFIESELSKAHPVKINDSGIEKTHPENVLNADKCAFSPFQTSSNLIPSDCLSHINHTSTPLQNNNQNRMLSVSSSSTAENRSVETEVARSLLNLSVNENSQRIAQFTNPSHRKENTNLVTANLNSGTSSFAVDCNIINDFDSRNSSRAGSSVSADAPTIRVVLNLYNTNPETSSNLNSQIPYSSGNGFHATSNAYQSLHSSIPSSQATNTPSWSLPVHRNNNYFSEPPFFVRRTVDDLDTPPDSESHLRLSRLPRVGNMVSSFSNGETNCIPSKSKDRSSTPNKLSRKRQRNGILHSSENTNEWEINQSDLNSSFSNIPSLHCEDDLNTLNLHEKGNNNHSVKGNENKELISRTVQHTASTSEKDALNNPRQIARYRNSHPSIYSDESEDDLSVSTLSLLSGEETDHSLLEVTDYEKSPKTPENKKSTISPKIKMKKLFREEKSALDSPTVGPIVADKSRTVKKPPFEQKKRQKSVIMQIKKPMTPKEHSYNLRSRRFLTPPTKLTSYVT